MPEQTLTSEWGREPLTVDALVPTNMLNFKLGRTHVGESDGAVLEMVDAALAKCRDEDGWTDVLREQTRQAALWIHAENRACYARVMSGTF